MEYFMIYLILIGFATGVIFLCSFSLVEYIIRMEKDECDTCKIKYECIAYKEIRIFNYRSNWISEWMLLTYFLLRKKCVKIKETFRLEYVLYLFINLCLTILLFWSTEGNMERILYGVVVAALLAVSLVDWRTQYIPMEFNVIICICGLVHMFMNFSNWLDYVIGLFAVSGFLYLVNRIATPVVSRKYDGEEEIDRVLGDGDIKLMAATGLLLGWKLNFLALAIGCIAGSVIHSILIMIKKGERQLSLGPYLALGVYITIICGEQLISWYMNILGA